MLAFKRDRDDDDDNNNRRNYFFSLWVFHWLLYVQAWFHDFDLKSFSGVIVVIIIQCHNVIIDNNIKSISYIFEFMFSM